MQKSLLIDHVLTPYHIKKHPRAKRARIVVRANLQIEVVLPRWMPYRLGELFAYQQKDWIQKNLLLQRAKKNTEPPEIADWEQYKPQALELVKKIIEKYQHIYPYTFRSISIRNHKSRWGSCSNKKNLNFNFRIVFLTQELAEYLVVHELCHLKQMNHSAKFWLLVALAFPQYKQLRKTLRSTRNG